MRAVRTRRMERKREAARKRGHEVPFGEAGLSEKREAMVATGNVGQASSNPSEAAKASGMPNSLMVTCPEVETRALRASRSSHDRR